MARTATAAMICAVLLTPACGGSVATPVPVPTPTPIAALVPPALVTPEDGVIVEQNDAATGCPFDSSTGYGFQTTFSWTPVPGAFAYRLYLIHPSATLPSIDRVISVTTLARRECGVFVIDSFLRDWQWRVRTLSADGRESDWSVTRTLHYAPCRTAPNRPCRLP